jgi:hypothetical protein
MVKDAIKNTIKSWIYGVLVIILIIFLVNLFVYFFPNPMNQDLLSFLNNNLFFILIISFLFFLGNFFYFSKFPINISFPIFQGFGSVLLVKLIINFIIALDRYTSTGIGRTLEQYSYTIFISIFIIVLIFGYISVFRRGNRESI